MIGLLYKYSEMLISGEGERKKNKNKKAGYTAMAGWPLSDLSLSNPCGLANTGELPK